MHFLRITDSSDYRVLCVYLEQKLKKKSLIILNYFLLVYNGNAESPWRRGNRADARKINAGGMREGHTANCTRGKETTEVVSLILPIKSGYNRRKMKCT